MVSGIYLFDLASRQANWLGVRTSAIAGNVANANTPGYKARDVEPFSAVLEKAGGQLATTDARHIADGGPSGSATKMKKAGSWETYVSGNSVSIEQELLKSGEVARQHQLGVNVVKSFHRMLMSTVKGGA